MLNHDFRFDEQILVLNPEGPLEVEDFVTLTGVVDAYLKRQGKLRGILIHAKEFPGWKDFGAFLAHLKFVRGHHLRIKKVAVVADGAFAEIMPNIVGHFTHAEVQHFDAARMDDALIWLNHDDKARPVA